jgi:hypothetical protein
LPWSANISILLIAQYLVSDTPPKSGFKGELAIGVIQVLRDFGIELMRKEGIDYDELITRSKKSGS